MLTACEAEASQDGRDVLRRFTDHIQKWKDADLGSDAQEFENGTEVEFFREFVGIEKEEMGTEGQAE
jgi:hypothetical protein